MLCPQCKQNASEVKRTESYDTLIIRRRKCRACGHVFPTFEFLEEECFKNIKDKISIA